MEFAPAETDVATFLADIVALHAQGRKVLISIGGATATVHLDSDQQRDQFVSSMTDIIDTYGFDGIDIDLEGASVSITGGTITDPIDASTTRLIDAVNSIADQFETSNGVPMMLTMAPETAYVQGGQSAFGGIWGAYLPLIDALRDRLDILQVQLYNSGSMFGLDGGIYEQGTADFIVSQTEAVLQGFNTAGGFFEALPPEKIAIGLPACPSAAGGGYVSTETLAQAVNYLRGTGPQPGDYTRLSTYPALRGLMTWSINWDAVSTCNATSDEYAQVYEDNFGLSTGIDPAVATEREAIWPSILSAGQVVHLGQKFHVVDLYDALGRSVGTLNAQNGSIQTPSSLVPGRYWLQAMDNDGVMHHASFMVE